jgi:hypothetical protein
MTTSSFRDAEQLSAYLDGQLSQVERSHLETRLKQEPELAILLGDLRNARLILHQTPTRRIPRNFTLDPHMARIRPPLPRLVPAFSWASAVAAFLFFITLGGNLLGQFSFSKATSMLAAAPASSQGSGLGNAPEIATTAPASDNSLNAPTPEAFTLMAPLSTPPSVTRALPPLPVTKSQNNPVNPWLLILPGLALILLGAAMLIRWMTLAKFRRRMNKK